jgi:hypothetical protein
MGALREALSTNLGVEIHMNHDTEQYLDQLVGTSDPYDEDELLDLDLFLQEATAYERLEQAVRVQALQHVLVRLKASLVSHSPSM